MIDEKGQVIYNPDSLFGYGWLYDHALQTGFVFIFCFSDRAYLRLTEQEFIRLPWDVSTFYFFHKMFGIFSLAHTFGAITGVVPRGYS